MMCSSCHLYYPAAVKRPPPSIVLSLGVQFIICTPVCLLVASENPRRAGHPDSYQVSLAWESVAVSGQCYFWLSWDDRNQQTSYQNNSKILLASFGNGCRIYVLVSSKPHSYNEILPLPQIAFIFNRSCFKGTCPFIVDDRLIKWSHFNKHCIRISHLLMRQCEISPLEETFNILTILILLINICNSYDKASQ